MRLSELLEKVVCGEALEAAELEAGFGEIMDGEASAIQAAALLAALRARGETVGDIVAIARALRARAHRVDSPVAHAVDTCGTGGTGQDTFNISTTVAFVVAGAGVPVAKHGNRAASSRAGSFDVLEALGVRIDLPVETCAALLSEVGVAPLFARTAHPSMRHLAGVRSELKIRTIMNCLGPLLNPLGVRRQLVGVYAQELLAPLAQALSELGTERALVVHGRDGLDELTLSACSDAVVLDHGAITPREIDPRDYGLAFAEPADLRGGSPEDNAARLVRILEGEPGAGRDVVLLNAAAALWVAGRATDMGQGMDQARESIDSGAARARLEALVAATQREGQRAST